MRPGKRHRGSARTPVGSALVLAVVLTSLLAMVGILFVMSRRVDTISTSAIADNHDLNLAVDSIVAKINEQLVLDVNFLGEEYYDYPDPCNLWLASLEPYDSGSGYRWLQISNLVSITGNDLRLGQVPTRIVPEHQEIGLVDMFADADGDGVTDSVWVELRDMRSGKGWPIYVAIRIVDNGAMVNLNTAYQFDRTAANRQLIDGSRLAQVHVLGFYKGISDDPMDIHRLRCNSVGPVPPDLVTFNRECAIRLESPDTSNVAYLPFEISDELELRNRFVLDDEYLVSRIENGLRVTLTYPAGATFRNRAVPVTSGYLDEWQEMMDPLYLPQQYYNYRKLLTTWNMDRIVRPDGGRMIDINTPDLADPDFETSLRDAVFTVLSAGPLAAKADAMAAQITANLMDYIDGDGDPEVRELDSGGVRYYGFERPCAYLSELAVRLETDANSLSRRSYAIEVHKPYPEDDDPIGWEVVILDAAGVPRTDAGGNERTRTISQWETEYFHTEKWEDEEYGFITDGNEPNDANNVDPNDANEPNDLILAPGEEVFFGGDRIELRRIEAGVSLVVDSIKVPDRLVDAAVQGERSFERDITRHKCIRRLWGRSAGQTLWGWNVYKRTDDANMIQAHPANKGFTNVGELGMVFARPAYYLPGHDPCTEGVIGYADADTETEDKVRVDLANPGFQQLTNYLTVFDPHSDGVDNDGDGALDGEDLHGPEWKIAGRININTAPWYVIAQLPWMTDVRFGLLERFAAARAIVAYRDKLRLLDSMDREVADYRNRTAGTGSPIPLREAAGFASVAELVNVTHSLDGGSTHYPAYDIRNYGRDANDVNEFPDLTPGDKAADDLEERDLIVARISNLATVRSDVFTAYILVRIGTNGPQKRVIAILDRSDVYPDPAAPGRLTGKVKVRALHPVPDPR